MSSSTYLPTFLFLAGLFYLLSLVAVIYRNSQNGRNGKNGSRLPPGPWGLPILGHLHMLGDLPHRNLYKLAKKFGPIMYIRLGLVPTIVVSSPEAAESFLKTHDLVFATRPKIQVAEYISYESRDIAFGEYGSRWQRLRKLVTVQLLSVSKIESMLNMRKDDVKSLVKWLVDAAEVRAVVDVSAKVASLVEEMTFRMIFGFKDDGLEFKSTVQEIMRLAGVFNIADYLPYLGVLDLQGFTRRLKAAGKVMDDLLEKIIDEHVRNASSQKDHPGDFIDVMLSFMDKNRSQEERLDRLTIKAIILDMIVGAIDTSATAIEWTHSELLRNPRVMKKVQSEIANVVSMDRMVEESELANLEYLDSVVKESMRLHPVVPLFIPHESREDIIINGYFIPKKTRVFVNAWAIGHDPRVWSANVDDFYPERFIGTNMDFRGQNLQFIPFGSGRRGCPGLHLGVTVVQLVVAQLVHCFNWELPNGMPPDELDMKEKFGLTMPRANHLLAIPSFRLGVNDP